MRKTGQLSFWMLLGGALWIFGSNPSLAAQAAQGGWPPWASGEKLVYRLFWPSGISLGEAVVRATFVGEEIHLEVTVEAELPQHNVSYSFSSVATQELCSLRFHQTNREGSRVWEESFEFDPQSRQVRRTRGSQTSVASVPECARDPLALLYYFRQQLALGNPLEQSEFHLGENFSVRIEPKGEETVKLGQREWQGEKFLLTYSGPTAQNTVEVWVQPDSARVPVAAKARFPLALFSAELQ